MRGVPFTLQQGQEPVELAVQENNTFWSSNSGKKKEGVEPRSVLDNRRSPSPPTSTSTLSSSLGGGGGSTDSAGVATVSSNAPQELPSSRYTAVMEGERGGGRKEDWVAELPPISGGSEIGILDGGEECRLVQGLDSILSESPGEDQSFLGCFMGEVDDPSSFGSLKQYGEQQQHQHEMLSRGPLSLESESGGGAVGGGGVFEFVDPVFCFEPTGEVGGGITGSRSDLSLPVSTGRFPFLSSISGNGSSSSFLCSNATVLGNNLNTNLIFSSPSTAESIAPPFSLPPSVVCQEPIEEKPQHFSGSLLLNQHKAMHNPLNPAFFLPFTSHLQPEHRHQHHFPPQPKRHHSMFRPNSQASPKFPFSNSGQDHFFLQHHPLPPQLQQPCFGNFKPHPYNNLPQRPMKPQLAGEDVGLLAAAAVVHHQPQQEQQALVDQLFKAAELVEAGNSVDAQGILARLNHHFSAKGEPLFRSAFYFKEALLSIMNYSPNIPPSPSPSLHRNLSSTLASPLDILFKITAYKAFSEISPILQFINFTCIQALLEELDTCDHIHIVDFDIGVGGLWSSFMQELAQRHSVTGTATPSLKITAFVSSSSHHHLELGLTQESLSQFARDLNIPFELNVLALDSFNPSGLVNLSPGNNEKIAVNFPVGSSYPSSTPAVLRLVKQLSPKIVVSVDHGCDRSDLSFSHHFLRAFQSCTTLLGSIDAAGTTPEVAQRIEQYLLQPRIESSILGHLHAGEKMLPWQSLFVSAGFVPVAFSNFTEAQAECLLKRIQSRGFHVEKRQASLLLCWQQGELVAVSSWRS